MKTTNQRYCKKGKHYADISLFNKKLLNADGINNMCRECRKKADKERKENKLAGTIKAF